MRHWDLVSVSCRFCWVEEVPISVSVSGKRLDEVCQYEEGGLRLCHRRPFLCCRLGHRPFPVACLTVNFPDVRMHMEEVMAGDTMFVDRSWLTVMTRNQSKTKFRSLSTVC